MHPFYLSAESRAQLDAENAKRRNALAMKRAERPVAAVIWPEVDRRVADRRLSDRMSMADKLAQVADRRGASSFFAPL